MKTLTILFESPNVFYAVIDGVNIKIDNPEILPNVYYAFEHWMYKGETIMVHNGDIFQVEGFEYELETRFTDGWMPTYGVPDNSGCDVPAEPYEVAILKLAKEEEPKENNNHIHNVWNKLRKMDWDHEYAENGIINRDDFLKAVEAIREIENLKK